MTFVRDAKPNFDNVLEHLGRELSAIRTGRATPALVEDLNVEAYGVSQPLKSLASISTPDAKTVQIEPWDNSVVRNIESAIMKSDIGINPNVDGKIIRLFMPMMTDENRQRMAKVVKERVEEAKIAVRKVREETKKKIEGQDGVSEDGVRAEVEELEKMVKEYVEKAEAAGKKKEEEIRTV